MLVYFMLLNYLFASSTTIPTKLCIIYSAAIDYLTIDVFVLSTLIFKILHYSATQFQKILFFFFLLLLFLFSNYAVSI